MALNQVMRSGGGSPPAGRDNAGMAEDKLERYLSMRDPRRTPEPMPGAGPVRERDGDIFVIQEHHATALHWDFRLERDGVLVSWAVPKGLPMDPDQPACGPHRGPPALVCRFRRHYSRW